MPNSFGTIILYNTKPADQNQMIALLLRPKIGKEHKDVHKTGNAVVKDNVHQVENAQEMINAKKQMMANESSFFSKNKNNI